MGRSTSSRIRILLGAVTVLTSQVFAATADATVSGQNGQIAIVLGDDIVVTNLDGSGQVNVTNHPARDGEPVWSPDGRRIAFTSDRDGDGAVWVMNADGSDPTRLTSGASPTWSPDGNRIAFGRDGAVWVLTLGGSERQVTHPPSPSGWILRIGDGSPTWSPDGSRIAFVRRYGGSSPTAQTAELWTVAPTGTGASQVGEVNAWGLAAPDWSPDGSRFALIAQAPHNLSDHVMVVGADGSGGVQLPIPAGYNDTGVVTWAPDGSLIIAGHFHNVAGISEFFTMRPDGSDQVGLGFSGGAVDWQALNPYPVGLVDPTTGVWHLRHADASVSSFYFGNPGDTPFLGDWSCDGVETPGLYRPSDGFVYLRNSNTQGVADRTFFFGNPGDIPIAGDFDGDGCDTVSIYRPSEQRFYIINQLGSMGGGLGAAEYSFLFGNPGDKPFVGDFDGDGIDEVGLHRESTGRVYMRNTLTTGVADLDFIYGNPGDRLVAYDWNGDGKESPAVFRFGNTTFYFRFTNTQGNANAQYIWGSPSGLPVAGDFD